MSNRYYGQKRYLNKFSLSYRIPVIITSWLDLERFEDAGFHAKPSESIIKSLAQMTVKGKAIHLTKTNNEQNEIYNNLATFKRCPWGKMG